MVLKEALTSAKLWEARYNAVEKSRQEYRENTKRLVSVNDTLQSAINQVSCVELQLMIVTVTLALTHTLMHRRSVTPLR